MADADRYRAAEREVVRHVEALIAGELAGRDRQLHVETLRGTLAVANLRRDVARSDQSAAIKRRMVELDRPDHALQRALPEGTVLDVTLTGKVALFFHQRVGHVRFVSLPPADELIEGREPGPMSAEELRRRLAEVPPPAGAKGPATTIVLAGGGLTGDARELARRDERGALALIEPGRGGGWRVHAPKGMEDLARVLDPEADADRRRRVRAALDARQTELLGGGVDLEAVAAGLRLPEKLVRQEAKQLARERADLRVKVIDGAPMLYREGSGILPPDEEKGTTLAMTDKLRGLFGGKSAAEKKVAQLSERRAALARQRDRHYDEVGTLEQQEQDLRQQFKASDSPIAKRRLTSQLVQLQKDLARRQQLAAVLNQQINAVGTHLHNLELVKQGQTAALPDADEMAEDAARAEEVLADLQANSELADAIGGVGATGLSAEEQALYDQLEAEGAAQAPDADVQPAVPQRAPTTARNQPAAETPRRAQPEAG